MKMPSRLRTVVLGVGVVAAGVFAAPQAASAHTNLECRVLATSTYLTASCKGRAFDSDVYRPVIRCSNGQDYRNGFITTPIFGGWGPTGRVDCPSGLTRTSGWVEIKD